MICETIRKHLDSWFRNWILDLFQQDMSSQFAFIQTRPNANYPNISVIIINKNDMNRSKMIANYNGFRLERVWIRTGLDQSGFGLEQVWVRTGLDQNGFVLEWVWIRTSLDQNGFGLERVWIRTGLDQNRFGLERVWIRTGLDQNGLTRELVDQRMG